MANTKVSSGRYRYESGHEIARYKSDWELLDPEGKRVDLFDNKKSAVQFLNENPEVTAADNLENSLEDNDEETEREVAEGERSAAETSELIG